MTVDQSIHSSANANNSLHEELEVLFEESAALANRLKKNARTLHRNDNLSASGRGLLQTLNLHGSMTVPQLAAARSTSRQNIQVLVDRLAAAGFIEFVTNPEHKRSVLVGLTEAGRAILASANEREATLLDNLLPQTASEQLREATALLRKLRFQLGGEPKRRRAKTATTTTTATAPISPKPTPKHTPQSARATAQPEATDDDELPLNLL